MTTRPAHLHASSVDGCLYDTRVPDCFSKPSLRGNYSRHHQSITSLADIKACLREGQYAWPGGYQLYFVTDDGCALSFDGVRESFRAVADANFNRRGKAWHSGWTIVALATNWEDDALYCEATGKKIPSAYGTEE